MSDLETFKSIKEVLISQKHSLDDIAKVDKAYKFAKEALKLPEELRYEGYFTLIQVCMFKGKDFYEEALLHYSSMRGC